MPENIREKMMNRLPSGKQWYSIANKDEDVATIRIYDEIGWYGVTEEAFARELDEITADQIEVQISSMGGDVFAGIAIYNALRAHPAKITTRVDSLAASAASVIVQAGDHRVMLSAGQLMIHEAWGLAIGNAADMRDLADLLDRQSDVIARIYAERSGGDVEKFRQMMSDETWFTDVEAVEAGLADEVVKPDRKTTDNSHHPKISELAELAMNQFEQFAAEQEKVMTFRLEQGKAPLSDDSVETLTRIAARIHQLTSTEDNPAAELARQHARLMHSFTEGDI